MLAPMAQEIDEFPSSTDHFPKNIDKNQGGSGQNSTRLRTSYSIKELESFRYFSLKEQLRRWREVYQSLDSGAANEYDGLRAPDQQNKKQQQKTKKRMKKKVAAPKTAEPCHVELGNGAQMEDRELKVDDLQECMCSGLGIGTKRVGQRNGALEAEVVGRRMNKGKRDCEPSNGWSYSRSEMESLRFVNAGEQIRCWKEVHGKLGSDTAEEFDGLCVPNDRKKQQSRNASVQKSAGKKADPSQCTSEVLSMQATSCPDVLNFCGDTLDYKGNGVDMEEPLDEYDNTNDEYDSSSDEYDSIQRPAFFVEGEPDFESGPPLDGLEFLRRVRWEAAQIPKVKVVKLNLSKLTSEQTAYMPNIPEIPKCPPKLLPSKDWENVFLAAFSELRQEISVLESSCDECSLNQMGKALSKQPDGFQQLKKSTPTLTAILGMDAVYRAATLRNSISSLESASVLLRDDCLWLFALCAAVDTPLHADTCASLRCLLRKCSGLLALKSEPDDEVAMLSILVTIAGKYFGQLDNIERT